MSRVIDDTVKWGLTQFKELFTVIPCAPKDFERYQHCYLKTIGSEIKNEGSLELEKVILRFLAKTLRDSKVGDPKGSR